MKKDSIFTKTKAHAPYSMPEGFLKDMENTLWLRIETENRLKEKSDITHSTAISLRRKSGIMFRTITLAAAAVTLLLICHATMRPHQTGSLAEVETAFDNLNNDEQQFLIDTEANDVFALVTENNSAVE